MLQKRSGFTLLELLVVLVIFAMLVAFLIPAIAAVRQAAMRTQSLNNLKQIAIAMHAYHDVNKAFPPAAICDKKGKPLLSWRVPILPYLEAIEQFQNFKLTDPWDSKLNKTEIPLMPYVYEVPIAPTKVGETYYRVFVGKETVFNLAQGLALTEILDGTSNTILCIEASQSVVWTKPADLIFDAKKPLPPRANFYGKGIFYAAFCDGSVRGLRTGISDVSLRAFVTPAGGDMPDQDDWNLFLE